MAGRVDRGKALQPPSRKEGDFSSWFRGAQLELLPAVYPTEHAADGALVPSTGVRAAMEARPKAAPP